jgi:MFS family permease
MSDKIPMPKSKKLLMWTIILVGLVQMPHLALAAATNRIVEEFGRDLVVVQGAFALPNFFLPLMSIITSILIGHGILSKRIFSITGLVLLGFVGVLALTVHSAFWNIYLLSVVLGCSTGMFIVNVTSIMFDEFNDRERQTLAGYQTAAVNGGGMAMSLVGGLLTAICWYGGYAVMLVGFPVAVFAYFTLPKVKRINYSANAGAQKTKMPARIYYYAACLFFFMILYTTGASNISTHFALLGQDNPSFAGIAVAAQMAGGVCSGIVFGRISAKIGDFVMVLSLGMLAFGLLLLGLSFIFVPQIAVYIAFVAMFIAGSSMSWMAPQIVYGVSRYVDPSNSAMATAISNAVAPSAGGFINPYVITATTKALFGESTAARFLFAAAFAIIFAGIIFVVTRGRNRKQAVA